MIQRTVILGIVGIVWSLHGFAQDSRPAAKADDKSASTASIQYAPPKRGAPKGRIGGGTRGDGERELTLAVVAPDHAGLSSSATPQLYWFVSRAVTGPVEASVIEDGASDAIFEGTIPAPQKAGVHMVDLEKLGVKLQPGKEYRWFVSLVRDARARSNDVVASGKVIYVPMEGAAPSGAAADRAIAFASAGYWYDAYAVLRKGRDSRDEPRLRQLELDLLRQAGLPQVVQGLETAP